MSGEPRTTPRWVLAPWVATPPEVAERMLRLAEVSAADVVFDLGCGDGRLLVEAARRCGARGVGVELEPYRVAEARAAVAAAGVEQLVTILEGDALEADVSAATVVLLYLVEWSTERVGRRLATCLRPGARIVSHGFAIGWEPAAVDRFLDEAGGPRTLYLWRVGAGGGYDGEAAGAARRAGAPGRPAPRPREVPMRLDEATCDDFSPHVGSTFAVEPTADEPALDLVLSEAAELPRQTMAPAAPRPPFHLLFAGPPGPVLPQRIYALRHADLGRLEIFLVPVGPAAGAMRYQAVFN